MSNAHQDLLVPSLAMADFLKDSFFLGGKRRKTGAGTEVALHEG